MADKSYFVIHQSTILTATVWLLSAPDYASEVAAEGFRSIAGLVPACVDLARQEVAPGPAANANTAKASVESMRTWHGEQQAVHSRFSAANQMIDISPGRHRDAGPSLRLQLFLVRKLVDWSVRE